MIVHLRLSTPADMTDPVVGLLVEDPRVTDVTLVRGAGIEPPRDVVEADVANNLTSAMQPIAAYSNGHVLAGGRPSASKTGTTQLGDTGYNKDAWFVGYTGNFTCAVWYGNDDYSPTNRMTGGSLPALTRRAPSRPERRRAPRRPRCRRDHVGHGCACAARRSRFHGCGGGCDRRFLRLPWPHIGPDG